MTVERFDDDLREYCCVWFVKDELKRELFEATSLQTASGPMAESVPMQRSSRLEGIDRL